MNRKTIGIAVKSVVIEDYDTAAMRDWCFSMVLCSMLGDINSHKGSHENLP